MGEGVAADIIIIFALERLQAHTPAVAHSWPDCDSFWLLVLGQPANQTPCRTEEQRRRTKLPLCRE
jgi:hypothetical protein